MLDEIFLDYYPSDAYVIIGYGEGEGGFRIQYQQKRKKCKNVKKITKIATGIKKNIV